LTAVKSWKRVAFADDGTVPPPADHPSTNCIGPLDRSTSAFDAHQGNCRLLRSRL